MKWKNWSDGIPDDWEGKINRQISTKATLDNSDWNHRNDRLEEDGEHPPHGWIDYDDIEWLDESSPQQEDWISVEDRLPEAGDFALVIIPNKRGGFFLPFTAMYCDDNKWRSDDEDEASTNEYSDTITHWQPLPSARFEKASEEKNEDYWKRRCEAAEKVIHMNDVFANEPEWKAWEQFKNQ